jgi:hypothetical protein
MTKRQNEADHELFSRYVVDVVSRGAGLDLPAANEDNAFDRAEGADRNAAEQATDSALRGYLRANFGERK